MMYTPFVRNQWRRTFSGATSNVYSRHAKTRGVHSEKYELYEDLVDPSFQSKYAVSVQQRNGSCARRRSVSVELANFKDNWLLKPYHGLHLPFSLCTWAKRLRHLRPE